MYMGVIAGYISRQGNRQFIPATLLTLTTTALSYGDDDYVHINFCTKCYSLILVFSYMLSCMDYYSPLRSVTLKARSK